MLEEHVQEVKGKKTTRKELVWVKESYRQAVKNFINDLGAWSRHIFDADWQFEQYSALRDRMPGNWLLSVVDFAENYRCFFQDEIASAYYQYSQATIHPAQLFYCCGDEDCSQTVSDAVIFISNDLTHNHHAVRVFNQIILAKTEHLKLGTPHSVLRWV